MRQNDDEPCTLEEGEEYARKGGTTAARGIVCTFSHDMPQREPLSLMFRLAPCYHDCVGIDYSYPSSYETDVQFHALGMTMYSSVSIW